MVPAALWFAALGSPETVPWVAALDQGTTTAQFANNL